MHIYYITLLYPLSIIAKILFIINYLLSYYCDNEYHHTAHNPDPSTFHCNKYYNGALLIETRSIDRSLLPMTISVVLFLYHSQSWKLHCTYKRLPISML